MKLLQVLMSATILCSGVTAATAGDNWPPLWNAVPPTGVSPAPSGPVVGVPGEFDTAILATNEVWDNFDGAAGSNPDGRLWLEDTINQGGTQVYDPAQSFLDGNGNAVLETIKNGSTILSGRFTSRTKFNMKYGWCAARIKFPKAGQAWFPGFWLLFVGYNTGSPYGEIDMMEFFGNTKEYSTHVYFGADPSLSSYKDVPDSHSGGDAGDGFHTYWMQWEPDRIQIGVDDLLIGDWNPDSVPAGYWDHMRQPFYFIANFAVAPSWLPAPDPADFPARMLIDWIWYKPLPAPDNIPPTVSLTAPAAGATVSNTVTVSANASDDVAVAGVQFKLDGANVGAEDTSSPYSISWDTWTAANGSHTLTALARDTAGNATTSTAVNVTVTNVAGSLISLLSGLTPVQDDVTDSASYELGMKFTSTQAGSITAIRYWKAPSETGAHTGRIWSSSGTQLAAVTFTGESASGWQAQALATPLTITAGATYVVTVNCNSHYADTVGGLATAIQNPPLRTVADGANGVFGARGQFPTQSWNNSNYFRDVVFVAGGGGGNNPPVIDSPAWADPNPVTLPAGTTVHVEASDPDGDPLTYAWSTVSGPGTATFAAPAAADGGVTFSAAGTCVFRVTVSDGKGGSVTSDVSVTVIGDVDARADVNHDGVVNALDLQLIIANFGQTVGSPGGDARADANADGVVNALDLQLVIANFGQTVGNTLLGWQVNAGNTGLAGCGIDKNSLPVQSGSISAGSTVTMKKLIDPDVSAGNITLDRCWIYLNGNPGTLRGTSIGTLTIKDCLIQGNGSGWVGGLANVSGDQAVTVLRCDISGTAGAFWFDGPATVQQCYLHDFPGVGDPATTGNHVDGITRRGGTAQLNIIDNCFDLRAPGSGNVTSAIMFQDTWGGVIDNILLQGNLLGGGGWVVYVSGSNFGTHLKSENNRFYPNPPYGYHCDDTTGWGGWNQWTNNYVNDPTKTDNKGAVVN